MLKSIYRFPICAVFLYNKFHLMAAQARNPFASRKLFFRLRREKFIKDKDISKEMVEDSLEAKSSSASTWCTRASQILFPLRFSSSTSDKTCNYFFSYAPFNRKTKSRSREATTFRSIQCIKCIRVSVLIVLKS